MSLIESTPVSCPYCGEVIDLAIDLSAGSQDYIEDCHICCQPIELHVTMDPPGTLRSIQARRQAE